MTASNVILVKQPNESRVYRFDFTDLLGSSETLSTVTGVTEATAVLTIATPTVDSGTYTRLDGSTGAASTSVVVRISGGVDEDNYQIECVVTTSESNTLEADATMRVRDTPDAADNDPTVGEGDITSISQITDGVAYTAPQLLGLIQGIDITIRNLIVGDGKYGAVPHEENGTMGHKTDPARLLTELRQLRREYVNDLTNIGLTEDIIYEISEWDDPAL